MESLSTIECLLLAQTVYEYGADAWQSVSNVLSKHPALAHRPNAFTPQSCHQIYLRLMNEASLECSDANNAPHAPLNLTLAQHHYTARLLHLRDLIAVEEARFKSLVAEIGQIRSGAWDDKIKAKLVGNDDASPPVDAPLPPEPEETLRPQEPQPPTTNDLVPTDDQPTSTQTPEDAPLQVVEEAPQTADTPVDTQIAEVIPVDETAPEPTLADVVDISEELTKVDISEASPPETAQMEVEEHVIPQDPEHKPDPKTQERKRKVPDSDNLDENLREKKRPRDESTPPDLEDQAYSRQRSTANGEQTNQQTLPSVPNKRFQAVIGMLHSQISQHRNGNIFHNPIKNSEAPDYHDIIKRPMDLKTIKGRVKDGVISNSLEFQRDVYLMFANAMMYNRPGSDIYHMAEEMMLESEVHINTFRQTEGFIRSTRS